MGEFRFGVLFLVLILLAGCTAVGTGEPRILEVGDSTGAGKGERMVEVGDMVEIGYIATLQDGRVFDTNYKDVALDGSLPKAPYFKPHGPYGPLILLAGVTEEMDIPTNASLTSNPKPPVIASLREAIVGMRIGEEKVVEVPPEKGYGPRDEKLVEVFPRQVRLLGIETVPAAKFAEATDKVPVKGERVKIAWVPWDVTVLDFNSTDVTMQHNPVLGTHIQLPDTSWNSTVAETGEAITLRAEVSPGEFIIDSSRLGLVKEVGDENFTVDFNWPYAGERLTFRLRVFNTTAGERYKDRQ